MAIGRTAGVLFSLNDLASVKNEHTHHNDNDLSNYSPVGESIPSLQRYRLSLAAKKQAREERLSCVFKQALCSDLPEWEQIKDIYNMLEQQVHPLSLEKMEARVRTVRMIQNSQDLIFPGNEGACHELKCFTLAQRALLSAIKNDDVDRLAMFENLLGSGAVEFARVFHAMSNSSSNQHISSVKVDAVSLLQDYDLLSNRLRHKSGIAGLSNVAREKVLMLCHLYMSEMERFEDIRNAAVNVRTLILTDLFSPSELKARFS